MNELKVQAFRLVIFNTWLKHLCSQLLKSGAYRHHQTLDLFSGDALPGLYCICFWFLLVLTSPHLVIDWAWQNISLLCPKVLGCFQRHCTAAV